MIIINIIHYPIDYSLKRNVPPEISWNTASGSNVSLWNGNWSQILGDEILKTGNPDIHYEVWRPDVRADRIFTHVYPNGLIYKLFPSKKVNYFYGLKRKSIYFSHLLIEEIENYRIRNKDLILHINAAFRYNDKLILDAFHNTVPIVAQFYTNPSLVFETSKTLNPLKYLHRYLIKKQLNDYYSEINNIIPSTQEGLSIFEDKYKINIYCRKNTANYGIDFNTWNSNTSKLEARKKLGIASNDFVIFSSSRLVPEKQIDLMLMSLNKIKSNNYCLYLSGNGPAEYEFHLKQLVHKLHLEKKISFIGFVPEDVLKQYYSASDVFISTSKSEAGPMSTALAALYELPIITTNTGLVYELLQESHSGLYIDKDDSTLWHEAFLHAIEKRAIARCPKQTILDFFDWRKIAPYYINTYKAVINEFNKK